MQNPLRVIYSHFFTFNYIMASKWRGKDSQIRNQIVNYKLVSLLRTRMHFLIIHKPKHCTNYNQIE